ncbi:hypothetical protein ACOMHN_047850 [Nucella lapillus]
MFRFASALCRINAGFALKQSQIQGSVARYLSVSTARHGSAGEGLHRTSDFDKKILVWTKRYPSVAEVPEEVTETKMKKAKDLFRIRVNIMMAIVTVGLCVVYVWAGKRAASRGENIHRQNQERHAGLQKND